MAKIVTGILAHVDAGKTTLSEALLFECGKIRNLGRVDSKNAFLDNNSIERERGITIFSKQANLNEKITLVDTPGHIDFSAEMERTLSILDAAILLINASDGVQSHTKTLWNLLQQHKIPTLIFVNKMDMPDTNKEHILKQLKSVLSENIVDFDKTLQTSNLNHQKINLQIENSNPIYEEIAATSDKLMEKYLNNTPISQNDIETAINYRTLFPCIFGSALKLQNIDKLLSCLTNFFSPNPTEQNFGCIAYKVSKDKQNNRLTHIKITGGTLKVKDNIGNEKINEIRIYSGEKYETVKELSAGEICTVTGLKLSKTGNVYGSCTLKTSTKMEPALIYSVLPPTEIDLSTMLKILRDLEEEFPELKVDYSEFNHEIKIMLMGEVQTEVLKQLIFERYNLKIEFGEGQIAYKETIAEPVIGVGHYEPLKHYAEVQLKLKPLARGEGLRFISKLSVDVLDTNWQRLILTHLAEKQHLGVLTGSPITDIEIEVIAGRAHLKHTEGGDFRQATYRAIRHGLMYSKSVLLEPFYTYEIIVPEACTGRVMSDMEKMHGTFKLEENKAGYATLSGRVPVATIKNYINEVRIYTKGSGILNLTIDGYDICHNQEEIVTSKNYNPEADFENPPGSVFCSHGAGFNVPWNKVNDYKHIK